MKKLFTILAMSGAVLGLSACDAIYGHNSPPPGHYETSTEHTTPNGTDVTRDTSTNVYYNNEGQKVENTDTKTTNDPPGLFNKSTTETDSQSVQ